MGRNGDRMTTVSALALVAAFWAADPATAAGQTATGAIVIEGTAVELDGELDVLYEDNDTGGSLRYFLIDRDRRIPLHFPNGAAPDLPSGTRVRVTGRMRNERNLAEGGITPTGITVMGDTAPRTPAGQDALVILFTFSNNTQRYPPATAAAVTDEVRRLYQGNSLHHAVAFTVAGWFTIAATSAGCDYSRWARQAEAAASAAGYNVAAFERRIFAFPDASSCSWSSMGNLAGAQSWVNGAYGLRVVADDRTHK